MGWVKGVVISNARNGSVKLEPSGYYNEKCFFFNPRYTPEMRADIGRYASLNGVSAASAVFSRKLGMKVSKSTVDVMKKAYLEKKRRADSEVSTLSPKKRGRPILLGQHVDKQVQLYVKKTREQRARRGDYSIRRGGCCPWNSDGNEQIAVGRIWWTYHFIQALGISSLESHELRAEKGYNIQEQVQTSRLC